MAQGAIRPEQKSISAYETVLELGRGGMGTVYVARAIGAAGFERLVVLKRLHPHLLDEPDAVQRFLDEARTAAWVQHANVVSTHQVGADDNGYFLVLEYVEGASLEELVDRSALRRQKIPIPIVLRIALDALAGLHAAHTAKDATGRPLEILHRDVTLQNVLVGRDGVSRVADFGIAKSAIGHVKTDRAYVVGKLLYLPPEYLRRESFGPPLDVYSLGVTLWLALSGEELFPGASEAQLLTAILERGIPPLSSTMDAPEQLDELIRRACDRNAANRFQSARAMADAIERVGRETGWLASHAEVADYVEQVAGVDLDRRRALIAERLATGERPSLDGPELAIAKPAPRAPQPSESSLVNIPGERKSWTRIAMGVGGFALLAAIGLLAGRALFANDSAAAEVGAPAPAPSANVNAALAEPSVTPVTASANGEPPPATSTEAEPSAPAPTSRPSKAAASAPSGGLKGNPYKPPKAKPASDITTTNPYKRSP